MKRLQFIGPSGSGKTTLLTGLIPRLRERGFAVAVVKHSHHDRPDGDDGDTELVMSAGAAAVAWVGLRELLIRQRVEREPTLDDIIAALPQVDLVLIESWGALQAPTVEVVGSDGVRADPSRGGPRIAFAADRDVDSSSPRFARDDVEGLAAFLVDWIERGDG